MVLETRYACLRYDILFITCPIAIVIRSVYVLWSVVSLPLWDINIDPCSSRSASKSNLVQYWAMRCRSWRSIEISRDMPIPCQQRPLTQHLQWMSQGLIPWGWVVAEYSQTVRGEVLSIFLQRSEEHTSELQSRPHISYAVFCLKKKKNNKNNNNYNN